MEPESSGCHTKLAECEFVGLTQVAEALDADRSALSAEVVRRVWNVLPGYSGEHLREKDLRTVINNNLALAVTVLRSGMPPDVKQLRYAVELGTSRALQGIPLDSIIQGFRVGEHIVIDHLLTHLDDLGPGELRSAVELIVTTYNGLTQESITSYRQASYEIAIHHEHLERDLVGGLALGEDRDAAQFEDQARLLGCDPNVSHRALTVVCVPSARPEAMLRVRRQVMSSLSQVVQGRILFGAVAGRGMLLIPGDVDDKRLCAAVDRTLRRSELQEAAVAGLGTRCPRLRSVGPSCRQALSTAEVAARRGITRSVLRYSDVLVDVMLLQEREITTELVSDRLGPLQGHSHLIDTLRVYLEHDRSQARTAKAQIVHVNTVAYRLARIAELTGRDPRNLEEATEYFLALRAADLMEADR